MRVFTGLFKASKRKWLKKYLTYLNAPPRPWREPKPPNGDEKKSCSVSKSKTFLSNRLSPMSKNEANGLLEPKNCAKVARGSPWNWYVNELFEPVPLLLPGKEIKVVLVCIFHKHQLVAKNKVIMQKVIDMLQMIYNFIIDKSSIYNSISKTGLSRKCSKLN